jgi:hypothetical protein
MAFSDAIKEQIYIQQLLDEFYNALPKTDKTKQTTRIEAKHIYTDSKSAVDLANNHQNHRKSKHIDIRYHFTRDRILAGTTSFRPIPGKGNPADGLTKPANQSAFKDLIDLSGLQCQPIWMLKSFSECC